MGAVPFARVEKRGDWSSPLISLCDPGMPKYAFQFYKSYVATASNTIVGSYSFPVYCLFHAEGQFFHAQCIQSRLPSIPGKPRCSLTLKMRSVSSWVGVRKYSSPKASTTARQKRWRLFIAVLSPMRTYSSSTYSSIASAGEPYASCRSAAIVFCIVDKHALPIASGLYSKKESDITTASVMRRHSSQRINCRRKCCSPYTGLVAK